MSMEEIRGAIIRGDATDAVEMLRRDIEAGAAPEILLRDGMVTAMDEVGGQFERGEIYVPEMLIAARAMRACLGIVRPLLVESGAPAQGRVAIGTVQGDLHDLGKNLVAMMLEGGGYEVIDLGVDVAPQKFVEAVADGVDVVALSALLTTTMGQMASVVDALAAAGLRERVVVIVGGAPLTQEFADQIGADGYAPDAAMAARLTRSLLATV